MAKWKSAVLVLLAAMPLSAANNDFSLSVAPSTHTLLAGQTGSYTVSTAVVSGAAQSISLSVSGLPPGITGTFSPTTVPAGGSSTLTLSATVCAPSATKQFTVTGTAKGKHSATAQVHVVAGPITTVSTPAPNAVLAGTVSISASATGCQTIGRVELYLDGAYLATGYGSTVTAGWDTTGALDGPNHSIVAKAYDSTGKVGPDTVVLVAVQNSSATRDFSVTLSPSSGTAFAGGAPAVFTVSTATLVGQPQPLQLAASGLPPGAWATLGSSSIVSGDSTMLTISVDPGTPAWTGPVTVSATGIYATRGAQTAATIFPMPPSISSVAPEPDGEAGDVVYVNGEHLDSTDAVTIAGAPAGFAILSSTTLTVTVPAAAPLGQTQLVVSNVAGSAATAFLVRGPVPWITSLRPNAAGPGAKLSVSGRHFVDIEAVELGEARAYVTSKGSGIDEFGFVDLYVPDGAVSGPVHVVTASRGSSDSGSFTLLPPLAMSPASGSWGTEVLVEGPGVGSATSVLFTDRTARFQAIDATHLKTWVPRYATSSHIVVVTPNASPSTPVFIVPRNGEQRVLVMRLQPTDKTQDCTNEELQSAFFGPTLSADALYGSASGGRLRVTGDVIGPLLIPYTYAGCTTLSPWFAAADDLARQAGYDPDSYEHKAYFMPVNSCGVPATGAPGIISAPAAYCGPGTVSETIHELGHSLGLQHASSPSYEYGDATDVMGTGDYVGPNAPHRIQLGLLADSAWAAVTSGSVTLAPLDGSSSALQVAWLPGRGKDYFVSYVSRIDVASQNLPDAQADHVLVHTVSHEPPEGLYPHTILQASLVDGQSYSSSDEGVRIDVLSHGGAGAQVALSFSAPTCFRDFPSFSAGPTTQSAPPGTSLTYVYSLTNNDAGDCPPSTFTLQASVNLGPPDARWQMAFDRDRVTLQPGESAVAHLTFTSPPNAGAQTFVAYPIVLDELDPYDHPMLMPSAYTLKYVVTP